MKIFTVQSSCSGSLLEGPDQNLVEVRSQSIIKTNYAYNYDIQDQEKKGSYPDNLRETDARAASHPPQTQNPVKLYTYQCRQSVN